MFTKQCSMTKNGPVHIACRTAWILKLRSLNYLSEAAVKECHQV